jgi:hypothetical protein
MRKYIALIIDKIMKTKLFITFRKYLMYFTFMYVITRFIIFIKTLIDLLVILIYCPKDFIPYVILLIKILFS